MAYDNIAWATPALVPALAGLPHAPFTAETLFAGLVTGYAQARQAARVIRTVTWPWNGRGRAAEQSAHARIFSDEPQVIIRARQYVPVRWTHAVAHVVFAASTSGVSYARHSLSALGSVNTFGAYSNQELAPGEFGTQAGTIWDVDRRNSGGTLHYDRCDVSLTDHDRDEVLTFVLDGHVFFETYRPLFALLALEIRDP